ncbi:MAG TPA: hypothetical protein VL974_16130, partial [Magnetospirillum sp.]|nr:hypothetical protein [Magnetospirillum sp.]
MSDTTIMRGEGEERALAASLEGDADTPPVPPRLVPDLPPAAPPKRRSGAATLLHLGALAATVGWLGFCASYVDTSIGWENVMVLQPQELGGLAGAALVPVAFLWLVLAWLDRGRALRVAADRLTQHLALLTYPAEGAESRIKAVSDSLRAQAGDLSKASAQALAEAEAVRKVMAEQVESMSGLVGRINGEARTALDALRGEVDRLTHAADSATARAREVEH